MMFPYTHGNHFQFGHQNPVTLDVRWMSRRENSDDIFVAKYGRAEKEMSSWRHANELAAKLILEKARIDGLTPVICYSGGIDSEVTLLSFIDALLKMPPAERISIEVATLYLGDGLNRHDTDYVERFRSLHNLNELDIRFQKYSLDPISFMKSEKFLKLADETQILSPIILCQVELCELIYARHSNALPVIGQGEIHLSREDDPSGDYHPKLWKIAETENLCGLYKYFVGRELPGIPGFFQYLPEQFETQLRTNPVLHELISHSRAGKLGTRSSKSEIIEFDYPELEERPKYTGFEEITIAHDEHRADLSRRNPACEAKWYLGVYALMNMVRVVKPEANRSSDWIYAWGQDGPLLSKRTSVDDVFATAWPERNLFVAENEGLDFGAVSDDFVHQIRMLMQSPTNSSSKLIHDGSLFARVISKAGNLGQRIETAAAVLDPSTINAATVARTGIVDQLSDVDNLALYYIARNSGASVIVPRLHHRIVNSEFDRELESTLAKPRFIWTESERLANLATALSPQLHTLPWTRFDFASVVVRATQASGWFKFDEPGPSNGTPWNEFLEKTLQRLGENDDERQFAESCARDYELLLQKLRDLKARCLISTPYFQVSSRALDAAHSTNTETWSLRNHVANITSPTLRMVSTSRWLEQAKRSTPSLRFGSNLFYQQLLPDLQRLESRTYASVAYVDPATNEEVAWAHVATLSPPPHGRLRIRGVTTRPDQIRRGFATNLLRELTEKLGANPPAGFRAIEVSAAPEIVTAFRRAGFIDDVSRVTRAEESFDPLTGEIAIMDRELTPLVFLLGES